MGDSNSKRSVWHQVRIIALLPLTIFLWMTGWTLYWIGAQRMSSRTAKKKSPTAFKKRIIKETLSRSS
ncbi:MAG TPA: hypothetical protein ENN36_10520 [Candidatus Bathyarchaeota archaeon]|nr:hypothetical protein [Candidatus Bathyarchaeota archaeon]